MADDAPKLPKDQSRPLTPGEIRLAERVFGNSIDYGAVRIVNGKNNWLQGDDTSVTPDGNIYAAGNYCDDFSVSNPYHFIHEMTHVWQKQNNILEPVTAAFTTMFSNGFNYPSSYDYVLDPKKDLINYNLEQQGQIVARYAQYLDEKENPRPPYAPLTTEQLEERRPFNPLPQQLDELTRLHEKNPGSPLLHIITQTGFYAFDSNGQAHVTQAFADKFNQSIVDRLAKEQADDKVMLQVLGKFIADPSYGGAKHDIPVEDSRVMTRTGPRPA